MPSAFVCSFPPSLRTPLTTYRTRDHLGSVSCHLRVLVICHRTAHRGEPAKRRAAQSAQRKDISEESSHSNTSDSLWLCKLRAWFCRAGPTSHVIHRTNSVKARSTLEAKALRPYFVSGRQVPRDNPPAPGDTGSPRGRGARPGPGWRGARLGNRRHPRGRGSGSCGVQPRAPPSSTAARARPPPRGRPAARGGGGGSRARAGAGTPRTRATRAPRARAPGPRGPRQPQPPPSYRRRAVSDQGLEWGGGAGDPGTRT